MWQIKLTHRFIQFQLFASLVAPTILYGYEVWRHEGSGILESLHRNVCKTILYLTKNRTNCMIYVELGHTSIECK